MAIKFSSQDIPAKKSTAARKDVPRLAEDRTATASGAPTKQRAEYEVEAGTQALPVDTPHKPKIGRPKTDFDRTEYQKLYMRDKATIKRLGLNCTVKEWREKNEQQERD